MFCLLIPYAPTDESALLARDVAAAIDSVLPRKVAAQTIGVSEADLSLQLSGVKPLNIFRLTALPEAFWHALLDKRAQRIGGLYVRPDLVTLLQGASRLRRGMATMRPRAAERKTA